jgi:hypothetical protein
MLDTITVLPSIDTLRHPPAPVSCAGAKWGCGRAPASLPPDGRATLVAGFSIPAVARLRNRPGYGDSGAIEALALAVWRDVPAMLPIGTLDIAFYAADDVEVWQFHADSLDHWQARVK